ncbi:MAG TPA: neutral zinc metallopeptidase [Thermoanaerobaculia bacterium]|nr:neutral zinc metallopeptidase [Thermoanaerobaculia bacterium]
MRWRQAPRSSNVSDRRGMGPMLAGGGGIGAVVVVVLYLLLGGDPSDLQQQGPGAAGGGQPLAQGSDEMAEMVAHVLGSTEQVWREQLPAQAKTAYREPELVLFSGATQSACGVGQAAMGPFYCPLDRSVYIDLSFYQELRDRFQAPGDFAQAYVIAHEVGHHIQTLLGISEEVRSAQGQLPQARANELSVRQELQADCLAGVWAHHARQLLEPGDAEEALGAASAIGDDRIQSQQGGRIQPESFTHGTSEQRMEWFQRGIRTGDMRQCDTFASGGR